MIETPASFAAFARSLAEVARVQTLGAAGGAGRIENKAGDGAFDPVTEADKAAERAMRRLIERQFPDHGIDGEEFERRPSKGRWGWSLDPIDGTRAYICGLPGWTTLIALIDDGEPVLGLIDAPRLGELYLGFADRATLLTGGNERGIAVSNCPKVDEARLSTTDPFLFGEAEKGRFERLRRAARVTRYGWDGYAYARLAAGSLDLVVESGLKPHDYLALVPLIRAAGGVVANWEGGPDLSAGRIVAAASPALLDEAVVLLDQPG